MLTRRNAPAWAFIAGIIEVSNEHGASGLKKWLESIGVRLAELEGPGIEGKLTGDLSSILSCPLYAIFEIPETFEALPREENGYLHLEELKGENPEEEAAASSVFCIMHHAQRRKRAELAGKKFYHLASRMVASQEPVFNDAAIEKLGVDRKDIEELLEKGAHCIFKYV
ncbi:MAG: hypothetical protein SYNGOMJ08_00772 [Candidatus Syntrophoarchaeum sp. GoM_oil]|nr:MAG: hypothetical protein SYNGOMJ08_00772 [Candidatus Syntrophoarchaeum sp. GoM_oil]